MTLTFFFSMFCSLSGISLSWKTLVFGRFTSQERTNVHRTAFFLHTPDFSLSKVTALKVVWGKDTSRRSKEPGSDLPSCFSAWVPFCKCGWRHHISRLWPGLLKIWLNPGFNLTIYLGTGATEEIRLTSFSTDAIVTAQINREIKQLVNKKRLAIWYKHFENITETFVSESKVYLTPNRPVHHRMTMVQRSRCICITGVLRWATVTLRNPQVTIVTYKTNPWPLKEPGLVFVTKSYTRFSRISLDWSRRIWRYIYVVITSYKQR